jgi:hypothetical protein
MMELNPEELGAVANRLRRAQGQIGGIVRLIEQGRDCKDSLTQLVGVNHALDRAGCAHRDQPQTVPCRARRRRLRGRPESGEALPLPGLSLKRLTPPNSSLAPTRHRQNSTATLSGIVRHIAVADIPRGIVLLQLPHNRAERDDPPGGFERIPASRSRKPVATSKPQG